MKNSVQGGLAGKARRVNMRSRATRLCAQQLICEFLEPDPDELHRDRPIPIRRHGDEFLPTAAHFVEDADSMPEARNLPQDEPVESTAAAAARPEVSAAPVGEVTVQRPHARQDTTRRRPPLPTTPRAYGSGHPRSTRKLTMPGFLCGCAVGSAAAAAVLFVLQLALG